MPYRKLPKTDQARIRTLKTAINLKKEFGFDSVPISYELLNRAKTQLPLFEHYQVLYSQAYENWQKNNPHYREAVNSIRLYISHFIQVFNMAVMRGEFKKEARTYYKLPIDNAALPDLTDEDNLFEWGKNLIDGEMQRRQNGGMPMTNPTIAMLNVAYELFKQLRTEQQIRQIAIQRTKENFNLERVKTDALIKEIWDEIESRFSSLPQEKRMENCQKCGIIYYYRNAENGNDIEEDNF
ncbi:MAG: hypothetical protein LBB53_06520 [Prevotellaceae bacterium]|jgi:hypothetical protein|nr:hypothetical protein [Prevotellaceae bacterium]